MEKYKVLSQVGEGSFGQVFKAKKRCNNEIVALKVIRKCGRSHKELKSLRQECKIQRYLHHPNIVQMIDSFETENEIVVVTEYADKELYEILDKTGRFTEERTRAIVCDLISALYYLHSNRVLHRDLKPQNVLLETNGTAKLCDFGFARSMSTGTHVLTSIKGTPLYMAPELIEEYPYDYNADLWSLGCIAYEMLVGSPPFQTTSILHLVRLIRFEAIKWPEYISDSCKSFLQGLLQKDPSQRLTWPELLQHSFVKGRILIIDEATPTSFTTPLSASQARAKQRQFDNLAMRSVNKSRLLENNIEIDDDNYYRAFISQPRYPIAAIHKDPSSKTAYYNSLYQSALLSSSDSSVDVLLGNLSLRESLQNDLITADEIFNKINCLDSACANQQQKLPESSKENVDNVNNLLNNFNNFEDYDHFNNIDNKQFNKDIHNGECHQNINYNVINGKSNQKYEPNNKDSECSKKYKKLSDCNAINEYIENEEWVAFLQRSMEEVIEGEIGSLIEETCVSVFISPLKNMTASSQVIEYIACLLSLPFVISISQENIVKIQKVYCKTQVVPNLICAMNIIFTKNSQNSQQTTVDNFSSQCTATLSPDQLQALECSMLLLCRLVYANQQLLKQFCHTMCMKNKISFMHQVFKLEKRKPRVVADLLAILNNILRLLPENGQLVEKIIFSTQSSSERIEQLIKLLTHHQTILKTRTCTFLRLLAKFEYKFFKTIWEKPLKSAIKTLTNYSGDNDDDENIKNIAKNTINEIENLSNTCTHINTK
ncbi:serine/threonine-protein kinase fused [Chelonus insularis]|uniref:serine/threonine-protein kinase fused n=1 Tax=Chelonus insularis TaxID=460826 RepID=UPI00158E384A|nr:serine/threonine-protein kinase fused [Chelonus insularis]